ncbi:MAG: EAL domain-containing protein [Spirochaetales bacterium]|nr:EAL domain-containing protein [Spirochaetales bacterium]
MNKDHKLKERILIVEDEKIIAFDLQRRLKAFGYDVVGNCATGAEALLLAEEEKPDLILMDIRLEGPLDGIETSKLIFSQWQIPSIFLTAYSDEATLERAKLAQPLGYLIKPFKERELLSTLDMAMYKSRLDAKLRDQERWVSSILNSIADGIIAIDLEQKIHFANPAALEALGLPSESVLGQPVKAIFSLLDEESLIPLRFPEQDTSTETSYSFQNALLQTAMGQVIPIEGRISQVEFDELPIGQVLALRDVSILRVLKQKLDHQAKFDALTGLLNRREFTALLTSVWQEKVQNKIPCAMLYLDLDQFKLINDTCGHLAGDELLRQVAEILRRSQDSQTTAIARLGGDEFAVLFENCSAQEAFDKAWMLKHQLNGHDFVWQTASFQVKASLGLIALTPDYGDSRHLLAAADDACYLAKEEGGNRIKVYDLADQNFRQRRSEMTLISQLGRALEENRFVLYWQEIRPIDPSKGYHPKIEVLLRLRANDGTLIQPSEFIPAAERYNLMTQIDRWVVRNSIAHYAKRVEKSPPVYSVNLSGESVADTNLLSFIKHEFKRYNVSPTNFCFEITETATIANLTAAAGFLGELKALGCSLALDDFGSGFSSFAYLKTLPVDFLKIDGAFIHSIEHDKVNLAMVRAMKTISETMGIQTIAEFVINEAVFNIVRDIGVDYAQGYVLGLPQPLE